MKVARDTTQFEFDMMPSNYQTTLEDEKDIYVVSLTDMMRRYVSVNLECLCLALICKQLV